MEPGTILCFKTTGELCVVLSGYNDGMQEAVQIRRPVMTHSDGIKQVVEKVFPFELETVEEHLRREAKEMLLKTKIQDEMMVELQKAQAAKPVSELVN
jgi:hypothetical protein